MTHSAAGFPRKVLWTRGDGCRDLAVALGPARQVEGDLRAACIRTRAEVLVARKLTSFDLVSTAVPHEFQIDRIGEVVAAVGGGPHSALAGVVAARLADSLQVPGSLASASPSAADDDGVEAILAEVGTLVPDLPTKVVRAEGARRLVEGFAPGTLLVVGAPGGSWMQRQFFGPGRQLVVRAPAGAVVVRRAPARCFHIMDEPAGFGPAMPIVEARRLLEGDSAPVVDEGLLVGIVRREALTGSGTVASVMEDPVFVREDDPVEAVEALDGFVSVVPVVDGEGRVRGVIRP